jgi:hypothetical protein
MTRKGSDGGLLLCLCGMASRGTSSSFFHAPPPLEKGGSELGPLPLQREQSSKAHDK